MESRLGYEGMRTLVAACDSGMGEAAARVVRPLGGFVVAVDVKRPSFDFGVCHEVDLRDPAAIDQTVEEVAGGGSIDALFHCAGLTGTLPRSTSCW